jgi:hypothetical protein
MPEPLVRREFAAHPGVEATAARFNVSEAAMHWRLYNLRLVPNSPVSPDGSSGR